MAMNLDTAIRLTAQVQGAQNLKGMAAQFQQLNATAQISGRQLDRLYTATQQFSRAAGGSINSLQQQRQALDTLRNAVDPASRRFQLLTRDLDNLDRRLQGLTRTSRTAGAGIRDQLLAGLATAGAGRLTAGVIGSAATFDQQVRTAAAIEQTAGSYDVLRREIERVAAAAAGTPTEVARLSVALSRAGFTAQETTQALAGVVRGAEATGISFEEMGSIAADNLRSFGLNTSETARVVDVLVQSANKSNQTVLDMGESMKYAAPISKSLGVSLEDTAATMALLANNGIRGSDAGTALRTGLTRLQIAAGGADSEIQNLTRGNALLARAMEALNADILDASGNLKPLDQVLIALRRNLVGLSTTDRSILAKALFGTEAGSKFLALINSTDNQINEMFGNLRNAQGIAEETQKKMQGFAYSLQVLRGNVEIVGNAIGDKFIVVLNPVVSGLNLIIGASQKLPKPLRDTAAAAGAAGVGIGGLVLSLKALGFLSTVSGALKTYAASTTAAGTASAVAAGKVTALGVALKGIAAIGIVTAGVSIVVNGINELNQARDQLKQARREAGLPVEDANAAQKAQAAATLAAIRKERESINRSNVLSKFIPGYEAFAPSAVRATRAKVLDEREKRARAIIEADLRPTPIPRPQPAAAAAGGLTTGSAAQSVARGASSAGNGSTFQPSSRARALIAAAKELGVSPLDLATIISFETRGSFNPSLFGGAGGNYMGLIQFGPTERRQYGARSGQSFEEQVTGPVVRYFKDRFKKAGMSTQGASLLDLYTTVLAGNPRASRTVQDSFRTSATSGVARMGPHRQKALQTFFGGSMANVGFDALEQAEAMNKAYDDQLQKEKEIAEQKKQQFDRSVAIQQEKLREVYLLESVDELQRLERQHEVDRLKRVETYRDLIHSSMTDQERMNYMEAQADEARANQLQYEKDRNEILKKQEEERLKLAQARLDVERNLADTLEQSIVYMTELTTRGRVDVGLSQGVGGYIEQLGTMREATAQLTQQGIRGLEDSMVSLATTGKANWREFTASVLEGTARMIIQQMVLAPLLRAIGGIGGGGIAQSFQMPPQYFLPAGGFNFEGGGYTGSGARSGGMDGRGGFLAMLHPRETVIDHTKPNAAGGNTTVVVNINTTTGEQQTQATDADRRRLGQDIAQVVDARLVYHKRQGGMLSGRR